MRSLLWMLTALGVISFIIGGLSSLVQVAVRIPPEGYWRGAVAFWILTITLRMMKAGRA